MFLRGIVRPVGARCDIGAFELGASSCVADTGACGDAGADAGTTDSSGADGSLSDVRFSDSSLSDSSLADAGAADFAATADVKVVSSDGAADGNETVDVGALP